MTQTTMRPSSIGSLHHLIGEGLAALDITQAEFELAESRYNGLGAVLDEQWSTTRGNNVVFAQGSFQLGTVVRNVIRNDDIDIDLVAKRDISKSSITQEELKYEVGEAVRAFAAQDGSGRPEVEESSRCWTLTWPEMHMDVLPAIPDPQTNDNSLLITDHDVRTWLPSNPSGYAQWFQRKTRMTLLATEDFEHKELEIQSVPRWRRRTVLQRVVQALKRHRDVHFADRPHERPASIIITTLAAHAYTGEADLYAALRQVVTNMDNHIEWDNGAWLLANPAQGGENFLDAWADDPARADRFFTWLQAAQTEFATFETKSGLQHVMPLLEASFGSRFTRGVSRGLANTLSSASTDKSLRMYAGGSLGTASAAGTTSAVSRSVRRHQFAGGSSN